MLHVRSSLSVYLLALFLVGLGYIAIMPPFEGFDEPAHYASLRQIADTGTIPLYGKSFLPQDVADYRGPVAYRTLMPPFDSGLVYPEFFAQPELVDRFMRDYRQTRAPQPYVPSTELNWEAQHPPLYYMLLAPLLRLFGSTPFVTQILILRTASYGLALGGVLFGLLAIPWSGSIVKTQAAITGFLLYPIMLPMFFPEFARIGNDSLCLLFAGMTAFCLNKTIENEYRMVWPLALGIALGLGLLTKAFFLPVTASVVAFLLLGLWYGRRDKAWRLLRIRNGTVAAAVAVIIGGGWYVHNMIAQGDLIGSHDAIVLAGQGGILAGLKQHFLVYALVRGGVVTLITWIWAGTWSLVRLSPLLYVPMLLLVGAAIIALALSLRRAAVGDPLWLVAMLFVFFGAGLLYHVVIVIASGGEGGTAGWYLHILMPWAAPALGLGIEPLLQHSWRRALFLALIIYALLFQAMALWAQIALFAGCATKDQEKYYAFPGHLFCLDQGVTAFHRLAIVGWPLLACIGFGGAILCAGWLAFHGRLKAAAPA